MTRDERAWFRRTFDAGNRPTVERARFERLRERADTLDEAAALAATYERRGDNATAGVVRFALEQRAKDTRDLLRKLSPLESAEDVASLSGSASAVSSGAVEPSGDLGRSRPEPTASTPPAVPAGPSPAPLTEPEMRLRLVAEHLAGAILELEGKPARRLMGGASNAISDYLRTIRLLALGQLHTPTSRPPLRGVDDPPPTLRRVK